MDPNACFRDMVSHYHDGINNNCTDALYWCKHLADDLIRWLDNGGFAPGNFDKRDVIGFARIIKHLATAHEERLSSD